MVVALLAVASSSCGAGSSAGAQGTFSVQRFDQTKAQTEPAVVAELGPGEVVQNSYTRSVIEEHKLPETARFLRWQDPDQPGVYYHVVIVEGKIIPKRYVWDSRRK